MNKFSHYLQQIELLCEQLRNLELAYPQKGKVYKAQFINIIERIKVYKYRVRTSGKGKLHLLEGFHYKRKGDILIPYDCKIYVVDLERKDIERWLKYRFSDRLQIHTITEIETCKILTSD